MLKKDSEHISGVEYSGDVPSLEICESLAMPLHVNDAGIPSFIISKHGTTSAFDKDTYDWIDQFITCIPDPLGINGETLIGQRRTERPQSKARPAPGVDLHIRTFKALFPIFAHPENEWLLSALIEGIENREILRFIYEELDSILDKQQVDNLKRKILLNPSVPENILFNKCIFCNVKPGQIIDSIGQPEGAFSIHNDFPFGPVLHKVLILQKRKHDISEITPGDLFCFYELMYLIAKRTRDSSANDFDGLTYGMNYGLPRIHKGREVIASGASQPHLHSQIAALTKTSFNAGDRVGLMCKAYRTKYDRDYLTDYETALRNAGLIIGENEEAILFVPIAQRFNYEVQIMMKNGKIGNILETTKEVRKCIGNLEHLTYQIYQHRDLNIQSFNTLMYATRFSAKNDYGQRLIISIYPRTAIIALSELAGRNVVDSFPWRSASQLCAWKDEVLKQGPRRLRILAIGAHPDDIELGCGGTILELTKRNHEVHALIVTDGCGGENRKPHIRETEANNAAGVLGLSTVSFGHIRDGQAQLGDTVFDLVAAQIDRQKPDLVICHANIASEHSDHKNISETIKTLSGRRQQTMRVLIFEVPSYPPDISFKPRLYVDIGSSIEEKKKAVNEHTSEISRGTISLEQVEQRARLRANEIGSGLSYAEAFTLEPADSCISDIIKLMPFALPR